MKNLFNISVATMVVTSKYVTEEGMPILEVHHDDDGGASLWQFHCDNGDYSMDKMQLVRLGTVLNMDATVATIATLPKGKCAKRISIHSEWIVDDV